MDGYQRISRYKSHLMGMAVMVVVYGHLLYYHSWLKNYEDLNFTIWYTLGSVEMFMFISGFGIYHSLKKNRDSYTFYRRRLSRLLPSFLPVMLAWCAAGMLMRDMTVGQALGNLAGLGWWFQQKQGAISSAAQRINGYNNRQRSTSSALVDLWMRSPPYRKSQPKGWLGG